MSEYESLIRDGTRALLTAPFLRACAEQRLDWETCRRGILVRLGASPLFQTVLEHGVRVASAQGFANLARVLQDNLNDETGVDQNGQPVSIGSHASWRTPLHAALRTDGVPPQSKIPTSAIWKS